MSGRVQIRFHRAAAWRSLNHGWLQTAARPRNRRVEQVAQQERQDHAEAEVKAEQNAGDADEKVDVVGGDRRTTIRPPPVAALIPLNASGPLSRASI